MKKTIFALATGNNLSAISIIRISGNDCKNIVKKLTSRPLPQERVLTLRNFYFPDKKNFLIDTCLIAWMPHPKSYTGEDSLEIYCHGGRAVFEKFYQALISFHNVCYAEQGEFTKRAIVNGKMNLVKAEAINDLINAETEKQRFLATKQLNNDFSVHIKNWRIELLNCMALVEAVIDFPEEEDAPNKLNISKNLKFLQLEIKKTLKNKSCYELIKEGLKVVLTGKPNVGKSSLFNYIIKKNKSIVSNIPGTTRDVIEAKINLKGYPVIIFDTAGINNSNNLIEKEGIKRALKVVKEADIVLNIYDANEINIIDKDKDCWHVINKIDKVNGINIQSDKLLKVSAKTGQGIDELMDKIHLKLQKNSKNLENYDSLISNIRQTKELESALVNIEQATKENSEEIVSEHLREANRNLGRILGNIDIEEVLGNIFSSFCIGK